MDWILQATILEWVGFPFSRGSSWPRNRTGVSCIAGRFCWAIREAFNLFYISYKATVRTDMKQQTGSKLGKECLKAIYCHPSYLISIQSQFSSVIQSCPTLCDPWTAACQASLSVTNSRSLLKLMTIESVMPSHPLSSSSPPAFDLSQHQGLFQWVSSSHQVAKVLEFQLHHQWIFRTDFL